MQNHPTPAFVRLSIYLPLYVGRPGHVVCTGIVFAALDPDHGTLI